MRKKKHVDPIPEEFATYEEAADFWDTHDTTDYPEAFHTVKVSTEFRGRHYEIELAPDVAGELRSRARRRGVTPSRLASDILRKQLDSAER
jgi:CopG antitoxin of type II toxin-antitoxin system